MKNLIIIGLIAAAGYYYFNTSRKPCETIGDVKDRAYELSKAFIHASTAKDSKLNAESLMRKIKNLESMKKEGFPNISRSCELIDEMMNELDY